ncbi:thiamine-monophosphate kinase [Amycolatopsis sp. NPDC049252]|uniref:thiamine-phosphate kinase n=1 Tax=Amycolatopsis sp. NPDC049252 TaxID=3363933 RepID=UPI003710A812
MQRDREYPEAADNLTLADVGEAAIIQQLITPRFQTQSVLGPMIGDDAAILRVENKDSFVVATTDPCPRPVAFDLGMTDYWIYGWLTMLINLSDLGAMGARPTGMLISTVMPPSMMVRDYERFLEGVEEASIRWKCPIIGGNVKDGREFAATGTALGEVARNNVLARTGMTVGDAICVVGDSGLFWAGVLAARQDVSGLTVLEEERLDRVLWKPEAYPHIGEALGKCGVVKACMDASDGVGGALEDLGLSNGLNIILRPDNMEIHQAASAVARGLEIDQRRLYFAWGDWQLVFAVEPDDVAVAQAIVAETGASFQEIGRAVEGAGYILIEDSGHLRRVNSLRSLRFSSTSNFTNGLAPYEKLLTHGDLLA